MTKFVYLFNEGNSEMKEILGGKGANLAEMTRIGLPVPFGFTISTQACNNYYEAGKQISEEVKEQILSALATLEEEIRRYFKSASCFCSFRGCSLHAGNDGHCFKPWNE
jgi:phosphoenolpyruvate synthase/pyruvate phosphate dikinase